MSCLDSLGSCTDRHILESSSVPSFHHLCHNAMLIQNRVIMIIGGTSSGRGTLSWDPEVRLNINLSKSSTIHLQILKYTFWWYLTAARTSNTVGGKAGATGSGTLGSFSCGGIEIRGGLSGLVEGRAAIQVSGWTCSYERSTSSPTLLPKPSIEVSHSHHNDGDLTNAQHCNEITLHITSNIEYLWVYQDQYS